MVQTFLPYPSFSKSLACLDNKRIQKQAIEALQIWLIITKADTNNDNTRHYKPYFNHHPCVKMWQGYDRALAYYTILAVEETSRRLTKLGVPYKTEKMRANLSQYSIGFSPSELYKLDLIFNSGNLPSTFFVPFWFGNEKYHSSHRAMLFRKNRLFYAAFHKDALLEGGYFWPGSEESEKNKLKNTFSLAFEGGDTEFIRKNWSYLKFSSRDATNRETLVQWMVALIYNGKVCSIMLLLELSEMFPEIAMEVPRIYYSTMCAEYVHHFKAAEWILV